MKTRGRVVQGIEFLRPKPKCPQTVATKHSTIQKLSIHLLSLCVCCAMCVICGCHTYERHTRHPAVAVSATHHSATHALAWMGTGGRADLDGHAGTSKVKNECLNQLKVEQHSLNNHSTGTVERSKDSNVVFRASGPTPPHPSWGIAAPQLFARLKE